MHQLIWSNQFQNVGITSVILCNNAKLAQMFTESKAQIFTERRAIYTTTDDRPLGRFVAASLAPQTMYCSEPSPSAGWCCLAPVQSKLGCQHRRHSSWQTVLSSRQTGFNDGRLGGQKYGSGVSSRGHQSWQNCLVDRHCIF